MHTCTPEHLQDLAWPDEPCPPALSLEMVLGLEKALAVSMDTLLSMQAWHDSYTTRERASEIEVERFTRPEPASLLAKP